MARGALEGERTLTSMLQPYAGSRGAVSWSSAEGWAGPAGVDIIYTEAYFDLSGYTADDLTLFPLGITLQDPGRYISSNANVPLQVVDIISQETLNASEMYTWVTSNLMPGMLGTTVEWTQMVWGQYRTFLGQATFQGAATEFLPASVGLFGSGSPTTVEKLYCYRFILMPGAAEGDTLYIPASRFVMSAVIAPEDEKAFLMRQKRSYELAT